MTDSKKITKNSKREMEKERLFKSGFYENGDIIAAEENAYDESLDAEELKKRRIKDWTFILIGVPVFIAFMYLIVMISR